MTARPRLIMWVLRSDGEDEPRTMRLPASSVKTVGRGTRADFVLPGDELLSRVHCRLSASTEKLVIEDLASTNGTHVNGQRVEKKDLKEGDRLRIGRSEFSVARDPSRSEAE